MRLNLLNLLLVFSLLGPTAAIDADESLPVRTEIGVSLIGTITSHQDLGSVALVQGSKSGRVVAVKKNYRLLRRYVVREIYRDYLVLFDGAEEFLLYKAKFEKQKKSQQYKSYKKYKTHKTNKKKK